MLKLTLTFKTHCIHVWSCRLLPCLTWPEQFQGLFIGFIQATAQNSTFWSWWYICAFFLFRFNRYMYPLQLLWNQSSVYRHGSNSISLYSCDSLLLPNKGTRRCKLSRCSSVACGLSEDVFVVGVKELLCLALQWGHWNPLNIYNILG